MATTPPKSRWFRIVSVVVVGVAMFLAAAILYGADSLFGSGLPPVEVLKIAGVIASLGALYGGILALDGRSPMSIAEMPRSRTFLCALAGAATVAQVWWWGPGNFGANWIVSGALVGAVLGWFGWRWARYVDI